MNKSTTTTLLLLLLSSCGSDENQKLTATLSLGGFVGTCSEVSTPVGFDLTGPVEDVAMEEGHVLVRFERGAIIGLFDGSQTADGGLVTFHGTTAGFIGREPGGRCPVTVEFSGNGVALEGKRIQAHLIQHVQTPSKFCAPFHCELQSDLFIGPS